MVEDAQYKASYKLGVFATFAFLMQAKHTLYPLFLSSYNSLAVSHFEICHGTNNMFLIIWAMSYGTYHMVNMIWIIN